MSPAKSSFKKDTSGNNFRARSEVQVLYKRNVEPKEGWDKYIQFLIDQLSYSEYDTGKPVVGTMIIDFEIDYSMVPQNFTFEESIDDDVNQAVVQLIQNGPGWKRMIGSGLPGTVRLRIVF